MKKNNYLDLYKFNVQCVSFEDGDNEYMVTYDQFPSVIGAGTTIEEAIIDAKENLDAYFIYCKKNAIVVPEPIVKRWVDDYSGKITLRIPKSLHRDIAFFAEKDGTSLNSILNDAIRFYLNQKSIEDISNKAISIIDEFSLGAQAVLSQPAINNLRFTDDVYNPVMRN